MRSRVSGGRNDVETGNLWDETCCSRDDDDGGGEATGIPSLRGCYSAEAAGGALRHLGQLCAMRRTPAIG